MVFENSSKNDNEKMNTGESKIGTWEKRYFL